LTSENLNPSDSVFARISGVDPASPVLIRMCPASVVIRYEDRSYVPTYYKCPTIWRGFVGRVQVSFCCAVLSGARMNIRAAISRVRMDVL